MTDTRRLQKDVRALVGKDAPAKTLPPRDDAAPLGAVVGSAKPRLPGSGAASGTGGIASPLTEPDASARTYHSSHYVYSSDGFFALNVAPLQTIDMLDANGSAVQMVFDDPYA